MENSANELQQLASEQINPKATETIAQHSDAQPASDKSTEGKPVEDKKSMKDTVYHYAQVSFEKIRSATDTVFDWSGELLVATGVTAGFAILGIFLLNYLGLGLLGGLAAILGTGLLLRYFAGIVGGRGFNPMNNFA